MAVADAVDRPEAADKMGTQVLVDVLIALVVLVCDALDEPGVALE